jgi:hypothetical protein
MDVCAFVGVAPRGPARTPYTDEEWIESGLDPDRLRGSLDASTCVDPARPRRRSLAVPVESWDDYTRLFGAFEGPGRLPYAVAAYFNQGGRRAYVVRIVHDYGDGSDGVTAQAGLDGFSLDGHVKPLVLRARNEGRWGNGLSVSFSFAVSPLLFGTASPTELVLPAAAAPDPGTLLRLRLAGGTAVLRIVAGVDVYSDPVTRTQQATVRFAYTAGGTPVTAETVTAALDLDDGAGRHESYAGLALGGMHSQRVAEALCSSSELVYPDPAWANADLVPVDASLPPLATTPGAFGPVEDAYGAIVPDDFFDPDWVPGDEGPASGVHALVGLPDVSSVVTPDLYEPAPLPNLDAILDPLNLAGPDFEPCVDPVAGPDQEAQPPELEGLLLDPGDPAELSRIVDYQQRLVELADQLASFIVLLDVPPGLDQRRIVTWRASFGSMFCAAYHPWLDVAQSTDQRNATVRMNPSAYGAGIIAMREWLFGVPFGPSNELAIGAVDVADDVSPARHDELHPLGINVFLRSRDGIELTAARTLSLDPAYRQLSVRRLVTMLERTLLQELQWVVFEPNNASLQADLRHLLRTYLRRLYRANAFAGATEDEAFFVRCDATLNTQAVLDAGQLIAQIGIAPAEPLEFLVVQLTHDGDGTLVAEGAG